MKKRTSAQSAWHQMILLSVLPVALICCAWRLETPTVVEESVVAEILAAAVSDPATEDCKPLVHSRNGSALSLDEVVEIAGRRKLRGLEKVLKELEHANSESKELLFPRNSPIAKISKQRYLEIFALDDPWEELQKSYPESCQLTKVSWPVVYAEGNRAAIYIMRGRGLLSAEVMLMILEREGTQWVPLRSVVLYIA